MLPDHTIVDGCVFALTNGAYKYLPFVVLGNETHMGPIRVSLIAHKKTQQIFVCPITVTDVSLLRIFFLNHC